MPKNINEEAVRRYLQKADFRDLFREELRWNNPTQTEPYSILVDDIEYQLAQIAEKHGVKVFECHVPGEFPNYPTRGKIQRKAIELAYEHLVVYTDAEKTTQIWRWVKHRPNQPTTCREHAYNSRYQSGDSLIQKLREIVFTIEEELRRLEAEDSGNIDLFGNPLIVRERLASAFDVERVTRRFYDRFKREHTTFRNFLTGIPDEEMQAWYVSVMLNRLMFIYFIQKKNFLDNDPNYLRTKLYQMQERGTDTYYKDFLCPLFFEGFAKPTRPRRPRKVRRLLGDVPYLNGGIFLKHEIETLHGEVIQIPDAAFDKLFTFFESYRWHLDDRPLKNDNEINPDVLGYIFEKYINQKQMGAYYTKEDITEYISKNTIVPCLFDKARKYNTGKTASEDWNAVWKLLQDDPDRYIYCAVRKGTKHELPPDIAAGIDDVAQRIHWNNPTPEKQGLPTEIWRETIARRQRYEGVRAKLANGEVNSINDLITYNLDIRRFAQDVIERCESPKLLRAFWKAITEITVLDPTCGSGAFLFAALNILEPLYEACLDRMQGFVEAAEREGSSRKYKNFREELERIKKHPNLEYFVLKSIIVNNLYGVDIMEEAIEICKLRLFLKMVAQLTDVRRIEPLPDIDFNVRAGNTLVGFATYEEVKDSNLFNYKMAEKIKNEAEDIKELSERFREQQTELGGDVTLEDKQELQGKLRALDDKLNRYLAADYDIINTSQTESISGGKFVLMRTGFHRTSRSTGSLRFMVSSKREAST